MKNKCYGCINRYVGCHSECNDYIEYKQELERLKKEERDNRIYWSYVKSKKARQNKYIKSSNKKFQINIKY